MTSRVAKDLMMAERMLAMIPSFRKGYAVAVVGNTQAHSERLVALVQKLAVEGGIDISHVTLKPIGGDLLTAKKVSK